MVQHVLLLAVAAPLLALAEVVPAMCWLLPPAGRRRVLARWGRVRREVAGPRWPQWLGLAMVVQMATMVVWHLVGPYDAAARNQAVHFAEHATFLVTATVFWWMAVQARRGIRSGAALIAVFVDSLAAIAIGAALLLAPEPLYPAYAIAQGTGALADQQLAGVVMWAYGGLAALAVGVGSFVSWLRSVEAADRMPATSGSGWTSSEVVPSTGSASPAARSRQMRHVR